MQDGWRVAVIQQAERITRQAMTAIINWDASHGGIIPLTFTA
jgi:hypothetical protein